MKGLVQMLLVACVGLFVAPRGYAQHMFLDTSGDGINTTDDKLLPTGVTTVSIWVETDRNRDGTSSRYVGVGQGQLTINQYEFVLRSDGGAVEWGVYTNLQPTMDVPFGPLKNATDYYHGYGGMAILPPGKYKLGTLAVRVKSGSPRLVFASSSPLWGSARTSFGSQFSGKDGDNTLKFNEDRSKISSPVQDVPGDWSDASGVAAPSSAALARAALANGSESFSVTVSPNPANPDATIEVRTTRAGFIRIQIFDLSGRLVCTALAEASAPAGIHTVRVPGTRNGRAMPSGVYLYRVETAERTVEGKLMILK
jgi:hypothetical protein